MRLRSGRAPAVILHGRKYWIGDGILPAGALAALPQEGAGRIPDAAPGRRRIGAEAGRGRPRPDLLAGRRRRLRQRGDVARAADEPPGDRAVALEGGLVRAARPASAEAAGGD